MSMVIVRLIGGLGNQLFQYAAGRHLAILHRTDLKLDITAFENYHWRVYSLKPFQIHEVFATREELAAFRRTPQSGLPRIVSSVNRRLNPLYRFSVLEESHLRPFDPNFSKTHKNVYLDGYWQSQKYFSDIQDVIRQEFCIKYEQDSQSKEIGKMIADTDSVSIHVRLGDYVSNPQINRVHGTCSLEYYQGCVKRIGEKISQPHFFVFSDDPTWVKANLCLDYPMTFVVHNDASRDYEDLRLMSMCKHHIIANSTFSWWGAWLCENPRKIVIAPQKWFGDSSINADDLIPQGWLRL